jgi:molybdate transport system substrate-binding protein
VFVRSVAWAALTLLALSAQALSADIRVFSGGAPQHVLRAIVSDFERATGHRVEFTFRLIGEIQQKLSSGEKADLIMLPVPLLAVTEKTIPLRAEGRIELARLGVGVIVREGGPAPDISNAEVLRKLLLSARAIAFDDARTPVGGYLDRMLVQLGIADAVRPKVVAKAPIDGGAELVAKGEADIGFYLVSEVKAQPGVRLVGLMPPDLRFTIVYGTAVPVDNTSPEPALAFVKFISGSNQAERWKTFGFEPAERR